MKRKYIRGTRFLWPSVVVLAFLSFSCGTPRFSMLKSVPPEEAALIEAGVIPNSRAITTKLSIGGLRTWRDAADLLNVQVQLVNKGYGELNFEYYFQWMDESGFLLPKDTTGWTPEVIYGYGRREITGVAPSPAASQFRVQINESD